LLKAFAEMGVEFAFPTQTVVMGLNGQSTGGACIATNPGAATVHCGHISESNRQLLALRFVGVFFSLKSTLILLAGDLSFDCALHNAPMSPFRALNKPGDLSS